MSQGFNRVVLFGNLGVDPELRKIGNGDSVLRMRLATNHSFVNREGTREDRTEWHFVSVWGKRAEGLARVLHKGSFVLVEGHIRSRSYEKDGQKRYATEINASNIVLGGRCGPSGHDVDGPDDAERIGEMDAMRDDPFDPTAFVGRHENDSEPPSRDMDPLGPAMPERSPRGNDGTGGAAPPPPPPPRKRGRVPATQTALAA